jgi:Tfp pilus assembly protein FimT
MVGTLPKRNDTSRIAGHTLLELMVVLALLLAVTSLVAPVTVRAYANLKLRLAAGTVAKAFQQAKSRALFEGTTFVVIFPSAMGGERQLVIARDDGRYVNQFLLPADVLLTARWGKGDWTNQIDPLPFYPDGTCEAIEMNLKNASRFPLRLTVDPMTAKASTVQIATDEQ